MQQALIVVSNVPDLTLAEQIATRLVDSGVAACVNILPGVRSVYRWQEEVQSATEVTMLIKSTRARYEEIEAMIKAQHPYEVPEIVALSIDAGLPAYLDWIVTETKKIADA